MISVVMPAYNAEKFIALAIDSILNQTFKDFELIIIDDGSTDRTLEIIKSYLNRDSRIRLIQNNHGGVSRACNLGVQESKYPWIARMDADDIALPQRFEKQVEKVNSHPNIVALGSCVHHINSKGEILSINPLGPTTEEEFYNARQAGHAVHLHHPTVILRKEVVLEVGGYDPAFEGAEDLDLFDRMAKHGILIALPEPLLLYRIHSSSASMQRFFTQKLLMRYVRTRHVSRLAGKEEPTFEEYLEDLQQRSWWEKTSKQLETLGMFYYRKAGLLVGEKQYLFASFYLGLSATFNPRYSIPRIWHQVFAPTTRQIVKKSSKLVR